MTLSLLVINALISNLKSNYNLNKSRKYRGSKMAVFKNFVCIILGNNVQKLRIRKTGKIEMLDLFRDFTPEEINDVISDDVGDFWIADNHIIKKIP